MTKQELKELRNFWLVWLVLALLTSSTFTFIDVATRAPEAHVTLHEGFHTEWQVWRPFKTNNTRFEMGYARGKDGDTRLNILGDMRNGITGEPVLIKISVNGTASCEFQQNDVFGWGQMVYRNLIPVQADCQLPEHSGTNHWLLEVVQVSPTLRGEKTVLGTYSPAGSLKNRPDNAYALWAEIGYWGGLIWLPLFIFMSLPLVIDGLMRAWAIAEKRYFRKWLKR